MTRMSALLDFANSSATRPAISSIWDSPALRFDSLMPAFYPGRGGAGNGAVTSEQPDRIKATGGALVYSSREARSNTFPARPGPVLAAETKAPVPGFVCRAFRRRVGVRDTTR